MTRTAQASAKQKILLNPTNLVSSTFARADIPDVFKETAANDNRPPNKREPVDVQISSNNATNKEVSDSKGSIPALPQPNKEDDAARKKSVAGQNEPVQLDLLQEGASSYLGPETIDALNLTKVKNKPGDNDEERNSDQIRDERQGEFNFDAPEQERESQSEVFNSEMNQDESRAQRIQTKLKDKLKMDVTLDEAEKLINTNFNVRFPFELMIGHFSKGVLEITGILIGIFITVMGFVTTTAGSFILPIFGTLAGLSISGIGLGISIGVFLLGIILTLFMIWLRMRYLKNASQVLIKVSFIRRRVYVWGLRRIWFQIFGRIIPLIGILIGIVADLLAWRYVVKEVWEIRKIVESTK